MYIGYGILYVRTYVHWVQYTVCTLGMVYCMYVHWYVHWVQYTVCTYIGYGILYVCTLGMVYCMYVHWVWYTVCMYIGYGMLYLSTLGTSPFFICAPYNCPNIYILGPC